VLAFSDRNIILVLELVFGEELGNCCGSTERSIDRINGVELRNPFASRINEVRQPTNISNLRLIQDRRTEAVSPGYSRGLRSVGIILWNAKLEVTSAEITGSMSIFNQVCSA